MKVEICELCFKSEKPCTCKEIVTNDSTAEDILNRIAPFLRRLIEPRFDENETNDYINGSSECIKALEAIQEWDSRV